MKGQRRENKGQTMDKGKSKEGQDKDKPCPLPIFCRGNPHPLFKDVGKDVQTGV